MTARSGKHVLKVGVDVGGTFTDVCVYDALSGEFWIVKVPTDPEDQADSVLRGIRQALGDAAGEIGDIAFVGHGTTVGLNALLERKGARIAFVTTEGFRDVLELARQQRPELYNFFVDKPAPLAPRDLRFEVPERTFTDGTVATRVSPAALRATVRRLRRANVEAVAIGFLNSYRNPANEEQAKKLIERMLPGVPITCSCEVAQEFREFERFSSAAMNAYLLPKVSRYLTEFARRVSDAGIGTEPLIFQSNGAVLGVPVAARQPVRTLMSGPAGGVLGAAYVATQAGFEDLLTFDMGGTSTDVALIEAGVPSVTSGRRVDGYPIITPTFDVRSIGAGGGSLAWVDDGGLIKVGPRSAGALPGPACYGRGGIEPAVTDADLVLGYLNPSAMLGGNLRIDRAASERVLDQLGRRVGLDRWDAAAGVIRIVTANIARLTQLVAFERGREPRDFTLVAFGGAGPLHAGLIARELGIRRIFVPAYPGVLCALGMLVADVRVDFSKTFVTTLTAENHDESTVAVVEVVMLLERLGQQTVREGAFSVKADAKPYTRVSLDLRYTGQNYEITVPARKGRSEEIGLAPRQVIAEVLEDFHCVHERLYGYAAPDAPVQLVTIRVGVGLEQPKPALHRVVRRGQGRPREYRDIRLTDAPGKPVTSVVLSRDTLEVGEEIHGPAVIEQMDSTVLILPDQVGVSDAYGNLIITEGRP